MKPLKKINMSPKEKAEQLYNKMVVDFDIDHWQTKQCALIAVDEVIANIEPSVSMDVISARIKYWKEVKQEIERL
jgi:hypothetical protein